MTYLQSNLMILGKILNLVLALVATTTFQVGSGLLIFETLKKKLKLPEEKIFLTLPLGSAIVGYLVFWAYFSSPFVGRALSVLILLASTRSFIRFLKSKSTVYHTLRLVIGLMVLTVFLYQSIVLIRDVFDSGLGASNKVLGGGGLPHDHVIPQMFADGLFYGTDPRDVGSSWRSGDRPPLQTGMWLMEAPLFYVGRLSNLGYQVTCAFLQSYWVLALFCLYAYVGRGATFRGGYLLFLFSGFFFVNTIYVWPKLYAAAFGVLGVIFLLYLTPGKEHWLLAGTAIGFSLLSHSGSAFLYFALLPYWFFSRVKCNFRAVFWFLLPVVLLLVPWSLYQKYYDPPGNRLVKMHFAAVDPPDDRTTLEALRDAYSNLDASRFWKTRWENLARFWNTGGWEEWRTFDTHKLRNVQFFSLFYTLGLMNLGLLLSFVQRKQPVFSLLLLCAVTLAIWNVLMILPGTTVVHQGSYIPVLLLFFVSAVTLESWMGVGFKYFSCLQLLYFLAIWFWPFLNESEPGGEGWVVAMLLSAWGIAKTLRKIEGLPPLSLPTMPA